jgi:DNA modification methylase
MASITSLQSDHKNARRRTDRSSELIKESLQRYGAARSIVIDEENRILAGNGTIDGAKAAGIKNVRIIESDGDEIIAVKRTGLSEEQKVGLALADNRTADLSEWDQAMLHQLSEEHDLTPWFNQEDLDELLAVTELEPEEGNTDPDDVPEPPEGPTTKPGDLWILGNHRLLCGDSTNPQHVERLMDGKKADMVFTDPPYGVEYDSGWQNKLGQIKNDDTILEVAPIIWQFLADDSAAFIWTSHHVYPVWRQQFESFYKQTIIWRKAGGGMGDLKGQYAPDYEMALFCAKGSPKFQGKRGMAVWDIGKDAASDYVHPTQKPVALAEQALADFTKARHVVLDLFGGSGSTLIACERQHRHARLMELDPTYCDVIVKRWENFTGSTAVCEPSDAHFDDEAD